MAAANGLRKLRANQNDKTPKHACGNCGCNRYSPCGCMKKAGYQEPAKASS